MPYRAAPQGTPLDTTRRLLDQTLTDVMLELGAHGGGLYLMIPGDQVLGMEVAAGIPPEFAAPEARLRLATANPATDAVRERRLVWVSEEGELAHRYPQTALVAPYHFGLAVAPITTAATVWGVLVLVWPSWHPQQLSSIERDRISAASGSLARLLRQAANSGQPVLPGPRARALPPPRTFSAGPNEALAAVGFASRLPEAGCALDLDGRITFISPKAADLLGESIARLLGALLWKALPWLQDPVYEDRYRDAVVSQQPTTFTALRPPDRHLLFQLYPDPSGISMRITPTHTAQRPQVPPLPDTQPPAAPTRLGAIYHLMHLAGALAEAAGVREVVELVVDKFPLAFDAQALALLVAEHGRLRTVGCHGFSSELMSSIDGTSLTSSTFDVLRLTAGPPSFFASRRELDQAYPDRAMMDEGLLAWAFLPLIASGSPLGICMLAYDHSHLFTAEERATLTSFGGLVAQALDRARLYDAKHELAHGLQASLLPHLLPRIPALEVAARYLPATCGMDIGGDFYDLIRLGGTNVAAVIGDVEGHNVTAAALMGQVRTAVHANAVAGVPPGEVLARTNRLLTDLDTDLITSCLYVHLDLTHHRAHLATAGHLPALLRHRDRHTQILDVPPGPLLGIDPTATYPAIEIPLPPGAVLALYTDGLVEVPGIDLDRAIDCLADTLTQASSDLEDLADALITHTQPSGGRSDDTALLLLRCTPPPR